MIIKEITGDLIDIISGKYVQAFIESSWERDLSKNRLKEFMQNDNFIGYVCILNDDIVCAVWGTIQQYYDGYRYFITDLFTSPEYQNKGYGTQLLDYAKKELSEKGVCRIMLISSNDSLHNYFYTEKNGFYVRDELCLLQYDLK